MEKRSAQLQNPLKQAFEFGQSIWYDGLVNKTEFARLMREDGVRGATTNPTIFEKAISAGGYTEEIKKLAVTMSDADIIKQLSVKEVQQVCDIFREVYDASVGQDGYVSIEVNPHFAHDTEKTLVEARELFKLVHRPNVMIKVPATLAGIPAIETLISEGTPVNVTLIFSISRYEAVMNAYTKGLEKRLAAKEPIHIASVASFFVSRVDAAVDKLLESRSDAKNLLGKTGIANSKAAYAAYEKHFSSDRFHVLITQGAKPQRPLWASTGTKNPNYSDVLYVESLMGPNTVNTIPPATMDAFRDHGRSANRLSENRAEALQVLVDLKKAGIDLDKITNELETQGVQLFCDSYDKIIAALQSQKK